MKVLLIHPPMTLLQNEMPSVVPPLGLAYIGAVLEREGYKVEILDAVALNWRNPIKVNGMFHLGQSWEDIRINIERSKPDVVGISCLFSSQSHNAHKVAELTKAYDTEVPVIMGGAHPSALPQKVLEDPNVDYAVMGEGEATTLEFLDKWSKDALLNDIEGLAYKEDKEVKLKPRKTFIKNLDSLPFPARHLLPMEEYFNAMQSHLVTLMRRRFTSMITSRGCPFNCVFCSIHSIWGYNWRARSPENVLLEIEHLVETFKVREIHFEDDNLTLDRKRIEKICDMIVESKLDIKWATPNGVAIWTLNKNLLNKMKKSGCYKLCFGIESGDANTLKFIRKPVNLTRAKKVIQWANEVGIWTDGFFVFGFPHESLNSINKTLKFAVHSDLDFANFFIASPYPGTNLLDIMENEGMISNNFSWDNLRVAKAGEDTQFFTSEELNLLQRKLRSNFFRKRALNYLSPKKLALRLNRIRSREDLVFLFGLLQRFTQTQKNGFNKKGVTQKTGDNRLEIVN
jgi:magnesium-protoporphyrin IX monomethyl ester (oxidative) cyclase